LQKHEFDVVVVNKFSFGGAHHQHGSSSVPFFGWVLLFKPDECFGWVVFVSANAGARVVSLLPAFETYNVRGVIRGVFWFSLWCSSAAVVIVVVSLICSIGFVVGYISKRNSVIFGIHDPHLHSWGSASSW
jgi:hypothetical protein